MWNLKTIRDVNSLKLYATLNGDVKERIFKAEVPPTNEFRMDFSANVDDPVSSQAGQIATGIMNLIGMAPALDVPAKLLYRGSSPVSFSVPCFLVVKDDPKEDLLKPLVNLMQIMLPSRGTEITQYVDSAINTAKDGVEQILSMVGVNANLGGDVNIAKYVGSVYTLNAPWPYGLLNGDSKTLTMRVGALRYDGVILQSVSIGVPIMLYEGGWPSYITLALSFRSLRSATVDSFKSLFVPLSN